MSHAEHMACPGAQIAECLPVPFHEVDARNVVPCWVASEKREYGARTIRPKIHKHLPEFLVVRPPMPGCLLAWLHACLSVQLSSAGIATPCVCCIGVCPDAVINLEFMLVFLPCCLQPYPDLEKQPQWTGDVTPDAIDWDAEIAAATQNKEVPEIDWCTPGEDAALEVLLPPPQPRHAAVAASVCALAWVLPLERRCMVSSCPPPVSCRAASVVLRSPTLLVTWSFLD